VSAEATPLVGRRVDAIDLTRGTLMVVIIFAHANHGLGDSAVRDVLRGGGDLLFMLGTPGFTLVSGLLLGYFGAVRTELGSILRTYARRGWLMLTTTHLLVAAAIFGPTAPPGEGFAHFLWSRWYITDTLAVIFIALAPLIVRLGGRSRLGLGLGALVVTHLVEATSLPEASVWLVLREVVIGVTDTRHILADTYPLLPMCGMFLVGGALGQSYGEATQRENGPSEFFRRVVRWVPLCVLASVVLVGAWKLARLGVIESEVLRLALYPSSTGSLFPLYAGMFLALFGYWVHRTQTTAKRSPIEAALRVVGKTSLFVYVFQYLVVQTAPYALGVWGQLTGLSWALLLAVSLPVVFFAADRWNARVKHA